MRSTRLRALLGAQAAPERRYGSRRGDGLRKGVPLYNSAGGERVFVKVFSKWYHNSLLGLVTTYWPRVQNYVHLIRRYRHMLIEDLVYEE